MMNEDHNNNSIISNESNCSLGLEELFKENDYKQQYNDQSENNGKLDDNCDSESYYQSRESISDQEENDLNSKDESSNNHLYSNDKRKEKMTYYILPEKLPRPNRKINEFKSREGTNRYSTYVKEIIYYPNVNSDYTVLETENSSIKLIRPSFHILSHSRVFYENTNLKYGLCIEPFKDEGNIQSIPINSKKEIVKCFKCGGYYTKHSHASITKVNDSIKNLYFVCCYCNNQKIASSSMYGWRKFQKVSIDYLVPSVQCVAYEMLIIDLSSDAIMNNFSSYTVDAIKNTINTIGKTYKRKACILAIDEHQICFYYLHSGTNIQMIKVTDFNKPFIPLPSEILFSDIKCIDNLLDWINEQIALKKKQNSSKNSDKAVNLLEVLIKLGIQLSSNSIDHKNEAYYHVILFLFNPSYNQPNSPPKSFAINNNIHNLMKSNSRVTFDLFIVSSNYNNFNINALLHLDSYSDPNIVPHYYQVNPQKNDIFLQYERLYYDLFNLLTSKRYYDITFNLITLSDFSFNLLSPYSIQFVDKYPHCISSTDDLIISYEITYKVKELISMINYPFQFWMTYLDPKDNYRHHRVLCYKSGYTNKINTLFSSIDISALLPLIVHGEIKKMLTSSKSINNSINNLHTNIENILYNSLYEYKTNVYIGQSYDLFSYPLTLACLPLYLYSFTKLTEFRLFKLYGQSLFHNSVYCKLYSLLHCSIKTMPLLLYNQMLRIDQKDLSEISLSIASIDMNMCLLYDNGEIVTLYIMKGLSEKKVKEIADECSLDVNNDCIKECIIKSLDYPNKHEYGKCTINHHLRNELMKYYNKVFSVEIIDDDCSISNDFLMLFKEDSLFIGEKSYDEFIWNLNQKIMAKCLSNI